jgi:hypothetical protein
VERPEYLFNILLPFISNSTLEAVLTIGFTAVEMKNADIIIQKRCGPKVPREAP